MMADEVLTFETVAGGVHLSEACAGFGWGVMQAWRRIEDDRRWCGRCATRSQRILARDGRLCHCGHAFGAHEASDVATCLHESACTCRAYVPAPAAEEVLSVQGRALRTLWCRATEADLSVHARCERATSGCECECHDFTPTLAEEVLQDDEVEALWEEYDGHAFGFLQGREEWRARIESAIARRVLARPASDDVAGAMEELEEVGADECIEGSRGSQAREHYEEIDRRRQAARQIILRAVLARPQEGDVAVLRELLDSIREEEYRTEGGGGSHYVLRASGRGRNPEGALLNRAREALARVLAAGQEDKDGAR